MLPFFFFICVILSVSAVDVTDEIDDIQDDLRNDRVIIGILSQKITENFTPYITNDSTYIAASYVKWIEGSGAHPYPLNVSQEESTETSSVHQRCCVSRRCSTA